MSAASKIEYPGVQDSRGQRNGIQGAADLSGELVRFFVLGSFEQASAIQLSRGSDISVAHPLAGQVSTMYKRKAQKVRPVDSSESDGKFPSGKVRWKESVLQSEVQRPGKDG